MTLDTCERHCTHRASLCLVRATAHFAPCTAHTLVLARWGGCHLQVEKVPASCIAPISAKTRVKEARRPEGSSAPGTFCWLVREGRALQTVLISLHLREHHPVRLRDPHELEGLLYLLKMVKALLHPVRGPSTQQLQHEVYFLRALNCRHGLCN